MKHVTIIFVVALLSVGCKSKPKEQPAEPAVGQTATNAKPLVAEPEPDPDPEPPPPPAKPLTDTKTSCEKDTDCVLSTLITEGERLCCVGCEPKAVSSSWLAESIGTCGENAKTKSIKCPPQKCEPSEFNTARCVDGTCQLATMKPGEGRGLGQ